MAYHYHIDYDFITSPRIFDTVRIFQLGRLHFGAKTRVGLHTHLDWFELTVVTEGKGIVLTNGEPIPVSRGDIYLSFPAESHKIETSVEEPLKFDFFAFNMVTNDTIAQQLKQIMSERHLPSERVIRYELLATRVSEAIGEFGDNAEYREELLPLLFRQIALYTIRGFRTENRSNHQKHVSVADELCFQIMHFINTNIYSLGNLSSLSENFGYNYSYLSGVFKKVTGNTISKYFQDRRLQTAKMLIQERKLKFSKIAEQLNYSSVYAFSKAFKKKYGVSPRSFQEHAELLENKDE